MGCKLNCKPISLVWRTVFQFLGLLLQYKIGSSRYTYKDFRKQAKIVRILTIFFLLHPVFESRYWKKMLLLRFNYEIYDLIFLVLCSLLHPPISLEIYSSSKSILELKKNVCQLPKTCHLLLPLQKKFTCFWVPCFAQQSV